MKNQGTGFHKEVLEQAPKATLVYTKGILHVFVQFFVLLFPSVFSVVSKKRKKQDFQLESGVQSNSVQFVAESMRFFWMNFRNLPFANIFLQNLADCYQYYIHCHIKLYRLIISLQQVVKHYYGFVLCYYCRSIGSSLWSGCVYSSVFPISEL